METASFKILFYWIDLLNIACMHARTCCLVLLSWRLASYQPITTVVIAMNTAQGHNAYLSLIEYTIPQNTNMPQ